jgi:tRNA modification GTPase
METICAIATARAASAIGVIRVSGDDAITICDSIVKLKTGTLSQSRQGAMRLGRITDGTQDIDEVLCVVFRAPASYTGENMVEINCHGGVALIDRVMRLLISKGARTAAGGEFTKRAFLNGKVDLIQAEAVCDLINSSSALDASLALDRMSGRLSGKFNEIFEALTALNTDILAYIDFPDEGLVDVDSDSVLQSLKEIKRDLDALEKSFEIGSVIKEGANTVILGSPNVGKSTLLNAIVGYDRSIVSDTAGTTRDMVSERAVMNGVTLNLCDTAGIRRQAGEIEKMGIDIATRTLQSADLVFAVFDSSRPLSDDDANIIELARDKNAIAVINKSDLPTILDAKAVESVFEHTVYISAAENKGIEQIAEIVKAMFLGDRLSVESGMLITNSRHFERVVKARERVENAIATLEGGFTPDLASIDITEAAGEIGQITGMSVAEKIIDDIFAKFCVGK